jgi:hypothetical protein
MLAHLSFRRGCRGVPVGVLFIDRGALPSAFSFEEEICL